MVKTAMVKLSRKGQMVLPKEAREQLGLQPGDMVIITIKDGILQIAPKPKKYADYIRGLGGSLWQELGGGEAFHQKEIESWE
jgi:AbrB family looped-hinge helix DNA binding protein